MDKKVNTKKFILWNANGINNKIKQLQEYSKTNKAGITLVTETHVKNGNVAYKNREHEQRGGVAIYIHSTINYTEIEINTTLEAVAIQTTDITIARAYNKPNTIIREADINTIMEKSDKTIIAGDLNAKKHDMGMQPNKLGRQEPPKHDSKWGICRIFSRRAYSNTLPTKPLL